jgi:hypothetical protein
MLIYKYYNFDKECFMIKTVLINPKTKETTEAFVDVRSLEQLYEFNGTGTLSIPLILENGDSVLWNVDSLLKKESSHLQLTKNRVQILFKKLVLIKRYIVLITSR